MPLVSFTSAITLARLIRYLGIGYLAIRYGNDALPYLGQHKLQTAAVLVVFVMLSYVASRLILRKRQHRPFELA